MDDVIRLRDTSKVQCSVHLLCASRSSLRFIHQIAWLLSNGYDIDHPNAKGETPLITAAGFGDVDVVKFMIAWCATLVLVAVVVSNTRSPGWNECGAAVPI